MYYYVLYFLAGALVANGVPHFVKGITGEEYQTPFGRPSTAVVNVVWGSFNFLIAWALWHYAGLHRDLAHTVRYEMVFGLGLVLASVMFAYYWSKTPTKATRK